MSETGRAARQPRLQIGPDMVFDNLEDALDAFATRGGAAAAETGGAAGAAAP